jgi:hypothetical protein
MNHLLNTYAPEAAATEEAAAPSPEEAIVEEAVAEEEPAAIPKEAPEEDMFDGENLAQLVAGISKRF